MATQSSKQMGRAAGGGLTSDINLNRGTDDQLLSQGNAAERAFADKEERLLEQAQNIRNLQAHIYLLEKQIERIVQLNPTVSEELAAQIAPPPSSAAAASPEISETANQIAKLLSQSTLLRSYESLMAQFELELNKKTKLVSQLERDYQQAAVENNMVCEQLLKLKSNANQTGDNENKSPNHQIEQAEITNLLKKNHDVMVEKYELYRQRNEQLEKTALEKEQLYLKIKSENDVLSDQLYTIKRVAEDLKQENSLISAKLTNVSETAKTAQEQATSFKAGKDRYEGQFKAVQEQLTLVQKAHDELAQSKQTETDLLARDLNSVTLKDRDSRQRIFVVEKELSECRDAFRSTQQELDVRTRENDHIVSLLEEQESKIALYEEKEKQVFQLAQESRKRIEDANLERDRVLLKEQQYLQTISSLESELSSVTKSQTDRSQKLIDALRQKHKTMIEQKSDEVSEMSAKLSDAVDSLERMTSERDSLKVESGKLSEQWRSFKTETSQQYEAHHKQISQQESLSDQKIRFLQQENEQLKDQIEQRQATEQQSNLRQHELDNKLQSYMREYEDLFAENKRLKELTTTLREEKEQAAADVSRLKLSKLTSVQTLQDESNLKMAHLESMLVESREKHKDYEERAYTVINSQEKIAEKWKEEHRRSVQYFERLLNQAQVENRVLQDQLVEVKSKLRASQPVVSGSGAPTTTSKDRNGSKSKDKLTK